ncbi:hypothetical protein EJ594_29625 [Pseudomonas aeruginosa]|nr:hypothetical protein CJT92_22975 [Pseudomonas aeruginosa]RQF43037.1 hypothetical protein IPC273_03845 [Pseudomonas aeruginosa]RTB69649.1 hypothetical protein EJ594_29625 [Pseudomonas aeruginosa]
MAACRREQRCSEGTPAEKRLGPDAGASLLVPFGRLQKELAWEGETRGQGRRCSGLLIPDTDLGENPCRERGA